MRYDDSHWAVVTSRALLIIRVLVGWVFLSEGIQKFVFPAQLGAGRFQQIGIPQAHIMAPFVGAVEITCGTLLLLGLYTRFAVLPLLAVIITAVITTKLPMIPKNGIWSMLHEARTDFSMVLGLIFLIITGPGSVSIDMHRNP